MTTGFFTRCPSAWDTDGDQSSTSWCRGFNRRRLNKRALVWKRIHWRYGYATHQSSFIVTGIKSEHHCTAYDTTRYVCTCHLMIQGYQALLAWREAAGEEFEIGRLVQVLQSCNMEDVAEVATSVIHSKSSIVYPDATNDDAVSADLW